MVLVLFGPKKLPELAQSFGKGMREFKKAQQQFKDQMDEALRDEPVVHTPVEPVSHSAIIKPTETDN